MNRLCCFFTCNIDTTTTNYLYPAIFFSSTTVPLPPIVHLPPFLPLLHAPPLSQWWIFLLIHQFRWKLHQIFCKIISPPLPSHSLSSLFHQFHLQSFHCSVLFVCYELIGLYLFIKIKHYKPQHNSAILLKISYGYCEPVENVLLIDHIYYYFVSGTCICDKKIGEDDQSLLYSIKYIYNRHVTWYVLFCCYSTCNIDTTTSCFIAATVPSSSTSPPVVSSHFLTVAMYYLFVIFSLMNGE